MDDDEETVTAYHEAGHAVFAEAIGGRVVSVSIIPADDDGPRRHGETIVAWNENSDPKALAIAQAKVALAGPAAELVYRNEQYEIEVIQEWIADWIVATSRIRSLSKTPLTDEAVLTVIAKYLDDLIEWFSKDSNWHLVATLSDELQAHQELEQEWLDEFRETWLN